MSTKQEALKVVVAAIATAGEKALRTDRNPEWLWWRDSTPEALNHVKQQLAAEKGGSEAANLIGCALRVFETGQCSEKSWKIVRIELEDARDKLKEAIEEEKRLFKEILDSVQHITGTVVNAELGLSLTAQNVRYVVAGQSFTLQDYASLEKKLLDAEEVNKALLRECKEAKQKLEAAEKDAESFRSHSKGWSAVCDVLHEVDPNWLASGTSAKDSAKDFIRVLAQKAKDGYLNLDFRRKVVKELSYKCPGWLERSQGTAEAAVNAIRELAGKKEAMEHLQVANERLRAKVESACKVLNS